MQSFVVPHCMLESGVSFDLSRLSVVFSLVLSYFVFHSFLQKYLANVLLFEDCLKELQSQIGFMENDASIIGPQKESVISHVLVRALERAPSEAFSAYLQHRTSTIPPQRDLARRVDDNCKLLRVLAKEMSEQVDTIADIQQTLQLTWEKTYGMPDELNNQVRSHIETESVETLEEDLAADPANISNSESAQYTESQSENSRSVLVAAALTDALRKEMEIHSRVASTVTLLTPSELVGTYAFVIGTQPFLSDVLKEEVSTWLEKNITTLE